MPDPLPISKDSIARALERADHYRLLNEPAQAESICRDIVAVDPDNEQAWIHLLLSLTDQFPEDMTHAHEAAKEALAHIKGPYQQAYYQGIIDERWGRANLQHGRGIQAVQSWINQAMQNYQRAMQLAPADDPDPTLRWNTCARLLNKITSSAPTPRPAAKRDMHSEYDEVPKRRPATDW
jgi:tetratricopeptide (TPR) repeat protein